MITQAMIASAESYKAAHENDGERCGKGDAKPVALTVILDYGWCNGTSREEVTYKLCNSCEAIALRMPQPVDPDYFFEMGN